MSNNNNNMNNSNYNNQTQLIWMQNLQDNYKMEITITEGMMLLDLEIIIEMEIDEVRG